MAFFCLKIRSLPHKNFRDICKNPNQLTTNNIKRTKKRFRSIVSQMQRASLSNRQAPKKSKRHKRHNWTHKKARQKTSAMATKVGGGTMKIPRIQVNLVSMLKNVLKCDSLNTKLFQLRMPKIVSRVLWILETKELKLGVLKRSSIRKWVLKFTTRYVCQSKRQ